MGREEDNWSIPFRVATNLGCGVAEVGLGLVD